MALHPIIGGVNASPSEGVTAPNQLESSVFSFWPIVEEWDVSLYAVGSTIVGMRLPFPVYQESAWLACLYAQMYRLSKFRGNGHSGCFT
jgi:hypothetical protein